MTSSTDIKQIFQAGRPLVERALDIAEQIAALREVATAKGLDWSQLKALMKAQIQDERDEAGDGKRVRRILEKAEFAFAYADMLGLSNMNENNFSAEPHDPDTGEIIEPQASVSQPAQAEEDRASAKSSSAAPGESGEQTQCATATVQFNDGPVIDMADRPAVERAAKEFMEKVHDDLDLPAFLDRRARVA